MIEMILVIAVSLLSLVFAAYLASRILKNKVGTPKMKEISDSIHDGAMTFLNKEYIIISIFLVLVTAALWYFIKKETAIAFIAGGIFSALAGNIGMRIATKSNSRTAFASKKSLNLGLKIAFSAGTVMGLTVVGLGLLGISILYLVFNDPSIIYGFGFGASSIALFARVGGGIFTKAADVGADLVGKVEKNIPEDDPRNAAVIADNVGDNVGDVAGMGADLFESYVDSIIAAMVLGTAAIAINNAVVLPMIIAAIGILSSIIGFYFVRGKKPHAALNKGIFLAALVMALLSFAFIYFFIKDIGVFYSTITGLVAGLIIGLSTQ